MPTKLQKAADSSLPLFLTLDELAWHLRISRTTALRMLRRGEFPVVRLGEAKHYRIPRTAVMAWEKCQTSTTAPKQEESPAAGLSERGECDGTTDKENSAYAEIIH